MSAVRLNRYRAGRFLALTGAAVAASAVAIVVLAQSASGWDLSFSGPTGGGGVSSQDNLSLVGTIGQPIVGVSSLETFKVSSGFLGGGGNDKIRRIVPAVASDGIPGQ
ncbi:MAG: hypothetical protein AB7T37_05280 [Dehalococcoidia bacterium]